MFSEFSDCGISDVDSQPFLNSMEQELVYRVLESLNLDIPRRSLFSTTSDPPPPLDNSYCSFDVFASSYLFIRSNEGATSGVTKIAISLYQDEPISTYIICISINIRPHFIFHMVGSIILHDAYQ
ncbi:hypothetical protein L2E82_38976 [Cichorium intybus]|uniref:Uncharacterized protein n=1 Tax=Cichorium intybus TaxID=13427 RepID=A0ACB9AGE0_CICIN|nr:hypothetical protein L2E82_38976 [Cichorium intybus]